MAGHIGATALKWEKHQEWSEKNKKRGKKKKEKKVTPLVPQ